MFDPLPHLDKQSRRALEVLSVLYHPVDYQQFRLALHRVSRDDRGVSETVEMLVREGLVVSREGLLSCAHRYKEPVMLAMARRDGFLRQARKIAGNERTMVWDPRDVRIDLYAGSAQAVSWLATTEMGRDLLLEIASGHHDSDWLDYLPSSHRLAQAALLAGAVRLVRLDATLDWVVDHVTNNDSLMYLWGQHAILRDRLETSPFLSLEGWLTLSRGDEEEAVAIWDDCEIARGRALGNWPAFLYYALLIKRERRLPHNQISTYPLARLLETGYRSGISSDRLLAWADHEPELSTLPLAWCLHWLGFEEELKSLRPRLEAVRDKARSQDFAWVARELTALLEEHSTPILDALPRLERWRRGLELLQRLSAAPSPEPPTERLIWQLHPDEHHWLEPRVQKQRKNGGWTAGRQVSRHQLSWQPPSYLSPLDRRIVSALVDMEWDHEHLFSLLEQHPLVFVEGRPVQLSQGRLALTVQREPEEVVVSLAPTLSPAKRFVLDEEAPGRWRYFILNEDLQRLARAVEGALRIPAAEEQTVTDLLGNLSGKVDVHTDLSLDLEKVTADPKLHLFLRPEGEGLSVSVAVKPLGLEDPSLPPGRGAAVVAANRVQAHRDLAEEQRRLAELPGTAFNLPTPLDCLEFLEEVAALDVALHWPSGQPFKPPRRAEAGKLRLHLSSGQNWFELEGKLEVDEGLVLDLRQLLEKTGQSRFIPLGEGEFLALSESFRQRLRRLADLDTGKGKTIRLGNLGAVLALEGLEAAGDASWQAEAGRLREARALEPELPEGFRAELRPYQQEGYRWLCQQAHWGAGACLADDMGLGKTIQTLALLSRRASLGPALVVAPTSVLGNWMDEAERFAPDLRVVPLGETDRQAALEQLGPGDVVVSSYGILVRESEALWAQPWSTLVLDEAQAIKNPTTQRFQAVVGLRADFRMATTGTPVENHLGELWALFRFLNPGLLGSLKRFTERFQSPIERGSDDAARERLRTLVRPFILRRTKDEVLKELPGKTEITVRVELGARERAFYESVRRRAVDKLANPSDKPGEQTVRVLAELMRLRRACCHPALVSDEVDVPAAKLKVFLRLLEELLDGGHRALVFSQFVDFLSIVRTALDERGIAYQYLDGSTPAASRRRRVDEFQSGEAPVFLISLKAGGVGLNLTAADYVIHLDPWWNPAVEDQASDRAHRLGQTRPVTIYRLVCAHTVEERIVQLHHSKRELAEGVLSGTDGGSRMSTEELMALLREEDVPVASEEVSLRRWIEAQGAVSTGQVMERYSVPRPRAKAMLERLVERGELRRVGERGRSVRYEVGT